MIRRRVKTQTTSINHIFDIITALREFRASQNIKNSVELSAYLNASKSNFKNALEKEIEYINLFVEKIVNCKLTVNTTNEKDFTSLSINDYFLEIPNKDFFDKEKALFETQEKIIELEKEIQRSEKMLANENFIKKAAVEKVEQEKNKYEDYKKQHTLLMEKINKLKK